MSQKQNDLLNKIFKEIQIIRISYFFLVNIQY